jgi:hypothetical protein
MVSENSLGYILFFTKHAQTDGFKRGEIKLGPAYSRSVQSHITEAPFVKGAYQDPTSVLSLPRTDKVSDTVKTEFKINVNGKRKR